MSKVDNDNDSVTSIGAAKILKMHPGTLANWRYIGVGPAFKKVGDGPKARVVYSKSELLEFRRTMKRRIARR